jgi:hypothetical protein
LTKYYQKLISAQMYGCPISSTTATSWATDTVTLGNAPGAYQVWFDNNTMRYEQRIVTSDGGQTVVMPKRKSAPNSNLAWLDQRVNELRVRL